MYTFTLPLSISVSFIGLTSVNVPRLFRTAISPNGQSTKLEAVFECKTMDETTETPSYCVTQKRSAKLEMVALSQKEHYIYFSQKTLGLGPIPPRLWRISGGFVFSSTRTDFAPRRSGKICLLPLWRVDYAKIPILFVMNRGSAEYRYLNSERGLAFPRRQFRERFCSATVRFVTYDCLRLVYSPYALFFLKGECDECSHCKMGVSGLRVRSCGLYASNGGCGRH